MTANTKKARRIFIDTNVRKLTEVEISMQEAREGKVNHYDSVEDMFQQLGI